MLRNTSFQRILGNVRKNELRQVSMVPVLYTVLVVAVVVVAVVVVAVVLVVIMGML